MMMLAADELGPSWVRVNSIRPGLIRTDLVDASVIQSPEISGDYALCTRCRGWVSRGRGQPGHVPAQRRGGMDHRPVHQRRRGHILRRGPDYSSMMVQMYGEEALRGVVAP